MNKTDKLFIGSMIIILILLTINYEINEREPTYKDIWHNETINVYVNNTYSYSTWQGGIEIRTIENNSLNPYLPSIIPIGITFYIIKRDDKKP